MHESLFFNRVAGLRPVRLRTKWLWVRASLQLLTFNCSKSTIGTLEKDVKYVQSYQ